MDDNLFGLLKARAASSGSSVSRMVEDAVRLMLNRQTSSRERLPAFELVTYGAGGQFSKYNIDKTAELIAAEDQERYGEPT